MKLTVLQNMIHQHVTAEGTESHIIQRRINEFDFVRRSELR
jgi:hypothetical protein